MFSNEQRCIYAKNQLAEVICQLRFPEILSIETSIPAAFQEAIRDIFPLYSVKKEGNKDLQTNNYRFMTPDKIWRVNLTSKFISLSCNRYTRWEDFAGMLDKPLAAFISIYKPAFFERIGLRYLNFISRQALDLADVPFRDLIDSRYLGIMSDEENPENAFARCSVDAEMVLQGGCGLKIHAGPGKVTRNGQADPDVNFILDEDLFSLGNIPVNTSAEILQKLHSHAFSVFRGAITQTLHDALDPQ